MWVNAGISSDNMRFVPHQEQKSYVEVLDEGQSGDWMASVVHFTFVSNENDIDGWDINAPDLRFGVVLHRGCTIITITSILFGEGWVELALVDGGEVHFTQSWVKGADNSTLDDSTG